MIAFLHDLPVWLLGLVIAVVSVAVTVAGIRVVGRFEPPEKRHDYNDIIGFVIAVVGVVHAVLLAWVAIIAWERYDKAGMIVEREAGVIGDIVRVASGLPAPIHDRIRIEARRYGQSVIANEWPVMRRGERPVAGYTPLRELQSTIVTLQPANSGQQTLHADLMGKLTTLLDARRDRIFVSDGGISAVVWWVVILGSFCLVGMSFFFGLERQRHELISTILALSTSLVVLMIVAMDRPFLGRTGIGPEPVQFVLDVMAEEEARE